MIQKTLLRELGVVLLLTVTYLTLKFPLFSPWLYYYDDGETLYHAFSILSGRIPYRDDITHHFVGYVLLFVILGKFFGISTILIPVVGALNQIASSYLLYRTLRLLTTPVRSLAGALLLLSAREPWVLSFFPLYQVNLLMVALWYLTLKSVVDHRPYLLKLAALIAGFAFICDQRALILILIPLTGAYLLRSKLSANDRWNIFLLYATPPTVSLLLLKLYGALPSFVEQTIIYPHLYRSGGTAGGIVAHQLELHAPLFSQTPLLVVFAALGIVSLVLRRATLHRPIPRGAVLAACIPAVAIPLVGGRGFDYYTIPYLPLLSALAVWSLDLLPKGVRSSGVALLFVPPLLSLCSTHSLYRSDQIRNYYGDGAKDLVQFFEREDPLRQASVYIWGYRPDLYIYLQRLSPNRFVNRQFIHPDAGIADPLARVRYVYPDYEEEFLRLFSTTPPDYLVVFSRPPSLTSHADDVVSQRLPILYKKLYSNTFQCLTGESCTFDIYRISPQIPLKKPL